MRTFMWTPNSGCVILLSPTDSINPRMPTSLVRLRGVALAATLLWSGHLAAQTKYFPPAGQWQRKPPAAVGMDSAKLKAAVDLALSRASTWDFDRDQERTFGRPLGPVPKTRAGTNGIIVRHGYIVAEFGDITANDPVYSVAKSFLSTVAAIAVDRKLIKNVNDPVASYVKDGGYDSPHNAKITWKNHLQQESEWEGVMWGKNANFLDSVEFGRGRMRPREIRDPGTYYEYNDARINRFALSLARVFGRAVPEVLKNEIMDPIRGPRALRFARAQPRQVGEQADRVRSVVDGRAEAERDAEFAGLRLSVVAQYEKGIGERAGNELSSSRKRIEHDLCGSGKRPRVRVALAQRKHGPRGQADSRVHHG